MLQWILEENKSYADEIDDLNADLDLAKRETKKTVEVHKRVLKESTNKLNQMDKANQCLQRQLDKKQHVINDLSSTHSSCRDILADYQRVKRRWVIELIPHVTGRVTATLVGSV